MASIIHFIARVFKLVGEVDLRRVRHAVITNDGSFENVESQLLERSIIQGPDCFKDGVIGDVRFPLNEVSFGSNNKTASRAAPLCLEQLSIHAE